MALSGLDIYKLLAKTNCKACGFPTCLAFAMQLAQKKISLDRCPYVSDEARAILESAAQPPMKLVTIGTGDGALKVGNETVMFRHEQKFVNPAGIGFLLEDALPPRTIDEALAKIATLECERVGQRLRPDLIALRNASDDAGKFSALARAAAGRSALNLLLISDSIAALKSALETVRARRPLIMSCAARTPVAHFSLAKEEGLPVVVSGTSLEEVASLASQAKALGVDEMVIALAGGSIVSRIQDFTLARRSALKRNLRALGYPFIAFTDSADPLLELEEAVSYVARYANIIIMKNYERDVVLPLLVVRQDIYADPQKPVQVEPRVYEIGKVDERSPVLVTTNFSITYFTVAGEVESSKVPSYIISCDAEGMSVLTAWAAEKFTAETITASLGKSGIADRVAHRRLIIPGYVAVLSGKLEELSGWQVSVGPREASGIPSLLKGWK